MMKRLLIAAAFLFMSAPLYAQQISVDRTRYCNDLSKWTSIARGQVAARNDAKAMDPYKCGPIPAPPPVPVNCVVSAWSAFSPWTPVDATTEQRTQTRTILTQPSNGGTACPSLTNTETRPIVVVLPPPPPPPPPPTPDPVPPPPAPDPTPAPVGGAAIFISPSGSDAVGVDGSLAKPFKTFVKAFGAMRSGGELVLLDGLYPATSCINYQGANDGMPPSGTASAPTRVHALNPGKVLVDCQLFLGRSATKSSYIIVDGISFDGHDRNAATLYNTSHVTIRNGGFHSVVNDGGAVFDVGTNDGSWGNTDNLFEDLWVWGQARAIASNYRADRNVWRRMVVRGDGCSSSGCQGSGNPNVGTTIYDSVHVTFENVIVLDRILIGSGNEYADFACAQHTEGIPGGDNMWLGDVSLNSPDQAFYCEPDQQTLNPSNTYINVVAFKPKGDSSFNRSGTFVIKNSTFYNGIYTGLSNVTVTDSLVVSGTISSAFKLTNVKVGPDPNMLYPLRSTFGATVDFRYVDRQLTTTALWPWPNEARIKAEICAVSPRGFCADSSLTHYIWNQLGHGSPY